MAPDGSQEQAAAKIATLTQLKGIGPNDATPLEHEIFYRDFRNRRELASWLGLMPTPWQAGTRSAIRGSAATVHHRPLLAIVKRLDRGVAIQNPRLAQQGPHRVVEMAEKLPDHREALVEGQGAGREGLA